MFLQKMLQNTFFIVSLLPIVIHGQNILGRSCSISSSGSKGICKLLTECKVVRDEVIKNQKLPEQFCGFKETQAIVCCPTAKQVGEISLLKCKEYSKYADNSCQHQITKRIVGGIKAGRKEFPHMAAIGFEDKGKPIWSCGGSIISEKFVLTVAHCLHHINLGPVKYVQVGVTNIEDVKNENVHIIEVSNRIAHPDYIPNMADHNIGLLQLKNPIKFNSFARPACLYTKAKIDEEETIATGWGSTNFASVVTSPDLLKVTLGFVTNKVCNDTFSSVKRKFPKGIIDDIHVCVESRLNKVQDTCQGDSGGPIQIRHKGDDVICTYDIVGLISIGKGCFGHPSVCTRVSYYIEWIEKTVWPENTEQT